MSVAFLLQYPEFPLALMCALGMVIAVAQEEGGWHAPAWLSDPAKSVLLLAPEKYLSWIRRALIHANWRSIYSFGDFASLKICLPLVSLISAAFQPLHIVLLAAIAFFFLPDALIVVLMKRRQLAILNSLPQALDLMVLCVDAGLGLDATLQKIAAERTVLSSALNEELSILGRDVLLGMDRERAYQELYRRTGVDELKTLGSALFQANKLGLSIARILRAQSEFIRKRQSQKAEEKALKMPIYMVFPMWFCIMPCLLVVVLGPSLLQFFQQLPSIAGR